MSRENVFDLLEEIQAEGQTPVEPEGLDEEGNPILPLDAFGLVRRQQQRQRLDERRGFSTQETEALIQQGQLPPHQQAGVPGPPGPVPQFGRDRFLNPSNAFDLMRLVQGKQPSMTKTLSEEIAELEVFSEAAGIEEKKEGSGFVGFLKGVLENPLTQTAIDLVSRTNFAVAGFAEEMLDPRGMQQARFTRAAKRAGTEFFSGLGGLEGQKKAFGQVLEDIGVPEGGQISDVIPGVFSETGAGIKLKRDGFFDATARGTTGLVLDIALDPLTYLTFGTARGARLGAEVVEDVVRSSATGTSKAASVLAPAIVEVGGKVASRQTLLRKLTGVESGTSRIKKELDELLPTTEVGKDRILDVARLNSQLRQRSEEALSAMTQVVQDASAGLLRPTAEEATSIARMGFKVGGAIYNSVQAEALKLAKQRVLAAARLKPSLLDKGGIKFLGETIPGTPRMTTAITNVTSGIINRIKDVPYPAAVLRATQDVGKAFDSVMGIFSTKFLIRQFPKYKAVRQAHLNSHAAMVDDIHQTLLGNEALVNLSKSGDEAKWKQIIDNIETTGSPDASWSEDQIRVWFTMQLHARQWADTEVAAGLLEPGVVRFGYVPHFFENNREDYLKVIEAWKRTNVGLDSIGRHAEKRDFQTLQQAVDVSTHMNRIDPNIPILKPIYDPMKILRRRGEAHADSIAFDSFYKVIQREFGEAPLPFSIQDMYDVVSTTMRGTDIRSIHELTKIGEMIATPARATGEAIRRLSNPGKTEFIRQRLLQVPNREALGGTLNELAEFIDHFPKVKPVVGQLAPDGSKYSILNVGKLKNMELPTPIAEDVAKMSTTIQQSRDVQSALNIYDRLNNTMKWALTVPWPSFHARNAYGNVLQSFTDIGLGALDPKQHWDTIMVMAGKEGVLTTQIGTRYSYEQLRNLSKNLGVTVTGRQLIEETGVKQFSKEGIGRRIGGAIETEARMQLWMNHVRRGVNPTEAADQVRKFLFDYSDLTKVERQFFRRVMPFYTWAKNNIRLQVENMAKRPEKLAIMIKPFRQRHSENDGLVEWQRNGIKMRLSRDGKTVNTLTGVQLPVTDLNRIWNGGARKTLLENLNSISPFLKTAFVEQPTGFDVFRGREFARGENAGIGRVAEKMPKPIRDWLNYTKETSPASGRSVYRLDDQKMSLLVTAFLLSKYTGILAGPRTVSTADRLAKMASVGKAEGKEGMEIYGELALNFLTGLREVSFDLDEVEEEALERRKAELLEKLSRRGISGPAFRATPPPSKKRLREREVQF